MAGSLGTYPHLAGHVTLSGLFVHPLCHMHVILVTSKGTLFFFFFCLLWYNGMFFFCCCFLHVQDVGNLVEEKHLAIHASNVMPIDLAPADIPASIDWREKGVVPPVTNQGECGVSNLFACVDSIDALWAIKHGHLVLGSYEECIDCCMKGSCAGTYAYMSLYQCVVKLGGLARADQYYSPNHTCQSDKYPGVIKISGAASVTPKAQEGVLAEVVAKQPVVVTVDASHTSFQFYDQGVYYNPNCSSTSLDHSMLVVGYGTENGEDYWIVKNSWGKYLL